MAIELKAKSADKAKKASSVPSKKSMNFSHHVNSFDLKKMAPALIILVIAIILFAKFGILDQMQKKTVLYSELSVIQAQQAQLDEKLAGYDELAAQYGRYSYGWMSEDEVSLVDRMEVYELIESKIMASATISNFAINENTVTLNLSGITLEEASTIVKDLESSDIVDVAYVYSAQAEDAEVTDNLFMTVTLVKEA